jgi:hypothetical protein
LVYIFTSLTIASTGIVSYFALYRWIFLVNLFGALLWLAFVIAWGIAGMFDENHAGLNYMLYGSNSTQVNGFTATDFFSGKVRVRLHLVVI